MSDPTTKHDCPHDSLSGDEGPVSELGRMPVRWRCDACGAIVYDDVNLPVEPYPSARVRAALAEAYDKSAPPMGWPGPNE